MAHPVAPPCFGVVVPSFPPGENTVYSFEGITVNASGLGCLKIHGNYSKPNYSLYETGLLKLVDVIKHETTVEMSIVCCDVLVLRLNAAILSVLFLLFLCILRFR